MAGGTGQGRGSGMTYRVFYQGRMVGQFASRDAALGFFISKPDYEDYEILDDSDN